MDKHCHGSVSSVSFDFCGDLVLCFPPVHCAPHQSPVLHLSNHPRLLFSLSARSLLSWFLHSFTSPVRLCLTPPAPRLLVSLVVFKSSLWVWAYFTDPVVFAHSLCCCLTWIQPHPLINIYLPCLHSDQPYWFQCDTTRKPSVKDLLLWQSLIHGTFYNNAVRHDTTSIFFSFLSFFFFLSPGFPDFTWYFFTLR